MAMMAGDPMMKNLRLLLATALLSSLPLTGIAAQQMSCPPAVEQPAVTGSTTLTPLTSQLGGKHGQKTVRPLRGTSAPGQNRLPGTLAIYN